MENNISGESWLDVEQQLKKEYKSVDDHLKTMIEETIKITRTSFSTTATVDSEILKEYKEYKDNIVLARVKLGHALKKEAAAIKSRNDLKIVE